MNKTQEKLHIYACAWRAYHETRVLCPTIARFIAEFIAACKVLPPFDDTDPTFIIVIRSILGLSQVELADRCHVHRQTVSRWECGLTKPKDPQVIQWMREVYEGSNDIDYIRCHE